MTIRKALSSLVLFLLIFSASARLSSGGDIFKSVPFPPAESESLLSEWFSGLGYRVTRTTEGLGQIHLWAEKDRESLHIILKPRSPLLTEVLIRSSGSQVQSDSGVLGELSSYLDACAKTADMSTSQVEIPRAVMQHAGSILCIENASGKRSIQQTGFFIDEGGYVITTAHDMEGIVSISLVRSDGFHFTGTVVKNDPHRDLVLIRTGIRPSRTIPFERGRSALNSGERIYTLGCPEGHMGSILAGEVSGLPRHSGDMPLWQAALRVLPGSSGSPVFDSEGNLVALVKGRYRGIDSVGFLIPFTTLMEFLGR